MSKYDVYFDEKEHLYLVDGTQTVPSVTTILGLITDSEYKNINPSVLEAAARRELAAAKKHGISLGGIFGGKK